MSTKSSTVPDDGEVPPPPVFNPRWGYRKLIRTLPGWPQAAWVLNCGHHVIVPTWADGRCSPKPRSIRLLCQTCREKRWQSVWEPWYKKHGAAWFAAHP